MKMYKGRILNIDTDVAQIFTSEGDILRVQRKENMRVGERIMFTEKDLVLKAARKKMTFRQLVTVPLLLMFIIVSIYTISFNNVYAVVSVDINPSLSLSIDKNAQVIGVNAFNEDAETLISSLDSLKGLSVSEAVIRIIKAAEDAEYLRVDHSDVYVAATTLKNGISKSTEVILEEIVTSTSAEAFNEDVTLYTKIVEASDYQKATELKMSLGEYTLENTKDEADEAASISNEITSENTNKNSDNAKTESTINEHPNENANENAFYKGFKKQTISVKKSTDSDQTVEYNETDERIDDGSDGLLEKERPSSQNSESIDSEDLPESDNHNKSDLNNGSNENKNENSNSDSKEKESENEKDNIEPEGNDNQGSDKNSNNKNNLDVQNELLDSDREEPLDSIEQNDDAMPSSINNGKGQGGLKDRDNLDDAETDESQLPTEPDEHKTNSNSNNKENTDSNNVGINQEQGNNKDKILSNENKNSQINGLEKER